MYHQCLFSTFVSSLAKKLSFSICSVGNCFYLLQKNFSIIHCVVFKEPCPALEARFSAQMAGYGLDLFSPILLREKAPSKLNSRIISSRRRFCSSWLLLRKEVIQPHLPIRLPCYDFTPIIDSTLGCCLLKSWLTDFGYPQLSWCDGRCVQGPGTYSRQYADLPLLAIPAS